jgi:hypothetical protein
MGSGKPKLVVGGMQLPDIKKQQGVGDKMKEGMEKGESGRGERRKTWGSRQKERMVFKMEVWEKMRRLCWIYKEQKQLMRR